MIGVLQSYRGTQTKGESFVKTPNVRLGLRVFLLIAMVITAAIGAGKKSQASTQDNDEAAVRAAILKSASTFETNDMPGATQVWAADESLSVFESGHANYGWADYRNNHLGPEMAEMKNTKYAFSDIKIHLAGNTAWATMKYTISADVMDNGKPRHVDGGGLATVVLEKRDGRWRIVHWHSSAPRRAPAATTPPKTP
jgi:ketosteroid isomerase-like protein